MPRQVSHERARLGEVALALLLVAALLAAFALAGTSDYESMRACQGAQAGLEVAAWASR